MCCSLERGNSCLWNELAIHVIHEWWGGLDVRIFVDARWWLTPAAEAVHCADDDLATHDTSTQSIPHIDNT